MNINLKIDRLILEGINISPSQRHLLEIAVANELSNLLTINGVPAHLQSGVSLPNLPLGKLEVTNITDTAVMGQQIAQQIYSRLVQ
jgi:hypothetical protein